MQTFAIAGGLSVLGSLGGVLAASLFLLFRERVRVQLIPSLVSYAVGTLLGVALLALVPEALETLPAPRVLGTLLLGILVFFSLEKLVLWRHCHEPEECAVHGTAAPLILIGDAFHTFVDGALIAAAVMTSIPLGVTTAIAVVAHEVPQEVGDFAILLGAGYSRRRAFTLNLAAGTAGIAGAAAMIASAGLLPGLLPYVLSFAAGFFLYVAMTDLLPDLHRGPLSRTGPLRQMILIAAGIATIMAL